MGNRLFNHTGFQEYLDEQTLAGSRCNGCGTRHLPPRRLCPSCYSTDMEWIRFSGKGVLEGFSVIYVGQPAMIDQGYSRKNPYCSGLIRLKEGPAVCAQILPEHPGGMDAIRVGMPLRAVFIEDETVDGKRYRLAFTT